MTHNGKVVGGQIVGGHTIVMVLVEGVHRVRMDTEAVLTLAESAPPAEEPCPECDKGRVYDDALIGSVRCWKCGGTGKVNGGAK